MRQRTTKQQIMCHPKVQDAMKRTGVVDAEATFVRPAKDRRRGRPASFALVSANRMCTCRAINAETLCAVVTARKPLFVAVVRTLTIDDSARRDVYKLSDLIKEMRLL